MHHRVFFTVLKFTVFEHFIFLFCYCPVLLKKLSPLLALYAVLYGISTSSLSKICFIIFLFFEMSASPMKLGFLVYSIFLFVFLFFLY